MSYVQGVMESWRVIDDMLTKLYAWDVSLYPNDFRSS